MENKKDVWVHIRKNETGEIRIRKDWLFLDANGLPNLFIWQEGNYSCDCNRALFFARANDEDEDCFDCGESEYSIKIMLGDECIYSEFERLDTVLQNH